VDHTIKIQAVTVTIDNADLIVYNVYIPPSSSCPQNYSPDFAVLLTHSVDDTIVLGDFNAHHDDWFSTHSDLRGVSLANAIDNSDLCSLNLDSPTRLPINGSPFSPDLSLISAHLVPSVSWSTNTRLNLDHLPISISFLGDILPSKAQRTFTNFGRADWEALTTMTELSFHRTSPPVTCAGGEKVFRDIINEAARRCIPAGYRQDFIPGLPKEAVPLVSEHDARRDQDPNDPEIINLNERISSAVIDNKQKLWANKIKDCNHKDDPRKYWSLLRTLSG
jgi:hypothetical protein